jgi:hypothetical protein
MPKFFYRTPYTIKPINTSFEDTLAHRRSMIVSASIAVWLCGVLMCMWSCGILLVLIISMQVQG